MLWFHKFQQIDPLTIMKNESSRRASTNAKQYDYLNITINLSNVVCPWKLYPCQLWGSFQKLYYFLLHMLIRWKWLVIRQLFKMILSVADDLMKVLSTEQRHSWICLFMWQQLDTHAVRDNDINSLKAVQACLPCT